MIKLKKLFMAQGQVGTEDLLGSFKIKYLENRNFIRSSIYWMVNSNDIDDLVQETFLKAWRSYSNFEEKSSFKTWVYRIAMNVTYDYLKKNNIVCDELSENIVAKNLVDIELSDLISKGMMKIPTNQREVFSLHYQQGLMYSEVSEILNIPEGTVKSRANSAKKHFVNFLEKNGVNYER